MYGKFQAHVAQQLEDIKSAELFKTERVIDGPQGARIRLQDGSEVLNLCANNYLGLAGHPDIIAAAQKGLARWGYGLSSARFICGTQAVHKELEQTMSQFLGTEDTILYTSCFDANGGLFETLLTEADAIISDELNHASIIDGIRLCKAQRFRYKNNDMSDLETQLKAAAQARFKLIVTDGVFSMEGTIANLKGICDLADTYQALVMVDDSHAAGVIGAKGRGSHEYNDVMDRVDIITGTLGKAFGGASGGYTSGHRDIITLLRQRSRTYLFSNALAPALTATSLVIIQQLMKSTEQITTLTENTQYFRSQMEAAGFTLTGRDHPIMPLMLGDAVVATKMADALLMEGVYVIGFSFPVVPKGKARIRIQMSAALSRSDIDFAVEKFVKVARELGVFEMTTIK